MGLPLAILMMLAGGFFFSRNILMLRNQDMLMAYLNKSPKAKLWVSKFGIEKTTEWSKKYFIPLGLIMSLALFCAGLFSVITQL